MAKTTEENCNLIFDFGRNIGIAFQVLDDYLDAFGNPETFGKQVGGDIIENKKTYLYLKALEKADIAGREQLTDLFCMQPEDSMEKIQLVKNIFTTSGADAETRKAIEEYTHKAFETLEKLDIDESKKALLKAFGENLMQRKV